MNDKTKERLEKSSLVKLQPARGEIRDLLEVLLDFLFDCGLDTIELVALLREVSIRRAVKKQSQAGDRISISRISAVTGISRAEISRALKSRSNTRPNKIARESVLNRILRAWRTEARYLIRGRPKPLKLFGRGASFEALVKAYGKGLPIRAVLDELMSVKAIELLSTQIVVFRKPFAAMDRVSRRDIDALRRKVLELLGTATIDQYHLERKMAAFEKRRNFKRDG